MKSVRQQKILELVKSREIATQEELSALLGQEGIYATQATISRDIRELKLKKKPGSARTPVYTLDAQPSGMPEEKLIRVLRDSMISMDEAMNLLIIKTSSGMAMAAAAALDACSFHEILGCIAGDDTIMCATRSVQDTLIVKKKIETIIDLDR